MSTQADRRAATIAAILAAARRRFAEQGFEATSIDDIAAVAGVAKGAVYHHFDSKETIFAEVLEGVQRELQAAPVPPAWRKLKSGPEQLEAAVLHYLLGASAPPLRRILLIDGPAVIGWQRWREIDDRYFGAGARGGVAQLLGPTASARQIDAHTHLLMGAVMEAALVCATADNPKRAARDLAGALRRQFEGLAPAPDAK